MNRGEAINWCIDNHVTFLSARSCAPDGWSWVSNGNSYSLVPHRGAEIVTVYDVVAAIYDRKVHEQRTGVQTVPPSNCRERKRMQGAGHPRSSCDACGSFSPKQAECAAALVTLQRPPHMPAAGAIPGHTMMELVLTAIGVNAPLAELSNDAIYQLTNVKESEVVGQQMLPPMSYDDLNRMLTAYLTLEIKKDEH